MNPLAFIFKLVPSWGWLALGAIALASLTAWHFNATHQARKEGRAEIRALWDIAAARAEEAARVKDAEYRAKEKSDADKLAQIQAEGDKRHAEITARAADLDRTVGGLRGSLRTALDAIRSTPTEAPAVTAGCAPARETASMLAGLSQRLAESGAVVARFADEAHAAGVACVRADDAVR